MLIIFFELSLLLFFVAIWGIIGFRANVLIILMSIELMLFSINLNFIGVSLLLGDITTQIFVLIILTLAAVDSVIGLAVILSYYRVRGILSTDSFNFLKG